MNVLMLYGAKSTFTSTVMEHLESYANHSRHRICFSSIHSFDPGSFPDLAGFEAVVLHYSFFPGLQWDLPGALERILRKYDGLKILYAQDEYDHTEMLRSWMEQLGIHCLFTCVPAEYVDVVYPRRRFLNVEFRPTLTGYVPEAQADVEQPALSQRSVVIGYRGRVLHPRYGHLAREKLLIGERMRKVCEARRIPVDIECTEDRRIYGRVWYEFLARSRATLGTESGSNVFDEDGTLRARIDAALATEPALSYDDIHERFIGEREGRVLMNQVSPRIFEAIAMGTALILFEGRYSGAVRPWDHYLPLKKDFSNIDQILGTLEDLPALEAMTRRARADVIESGIYGYAAFVRDFDAYVESRASPRSRSIGHVIPIAGHRGDRAGSLDMAPCSATTRPIDAKWIAPLVGNKSSDRAPARRGMRSLLGRLFG